MLYEHMSLNTCFVKINMSFKCFHVFTVSSKRKEMLPYLTHQGRGSITENTIAPRLPGQNAQLWSIE